MVRGAILPWSVFELLEESASVRAARRQYIGEMRMSWLRQAISNGIRCDRNPRRIGVPEKCFRASSLKIDYLKSWLTKRTRRTLRLPNDLG